MSSNFTGNQKKLGTVRLLKIGLIVFPISLVINIIFMKLQVHGIARELSRIGVLVGFFLIVFGGIYKLVKK